MPHPSPSALDLATSCPAALASFCGPAVTEAVALTCSGVVSTSPGERGPRSSSTNWIPGASGFPAVAKKGPHNADKGGNTHGVNVDQKGRGAWEELPIDHRTSLSPTNSSSPWRHPKWLSYNHVNFLVRPLLACICFPSFPVSLFPSPLLPWACNYPCETLTLKLCFKLCFLGSPDRQTMHLLEDKGFINPQRLLGLFSSPCIPTLPH